MSGRSAGQEQQRTTRPVDGRAAVVAAASLGLAVVGWTQSGCSDPPTAADRTAATLAAGVLGVARATREVAEPYRCARVLTADDPAAATRHEVAGSTWHRTGQVLQLAAGGKPGRAAPLVLGVVTDARGTDRYLPQIRRAFELGGVQLVVSLGGMGTMADEIRPLLEALAAPERWPLIAIPGDREAISEHRDAVTSLADRAVFDGGRIRRVQARGVTLVTLPGAPDARRLSAAKEGCVVTPEDALAVAQELDPASGVRVLLTHAPPRGRGAGASDRTPDGIHVGETWIADVAQAARAQVVVHGLIAPGLPGLVGTVKLGGRRRPARPAAEARPLVLSAGAADGLGDLYTHLTAPAVGRVESHHPLALIVTLKPAQVSWHGVEKSRK